MVAGIHFHRERFYESRLPLLIQLPLVWFNWLRALNVIKIAELFEDTRILRTCGWLAFHINEALRESQVKCIASLDFCNIFCTEFQTESFHVSLQVGDSATANDWDYVGCLLKF